MPIFKERTSVTPISTWQTFVGPTSRRRTCAEPTSRGLTSWGADLRGADLREVDLSDIKNWAEIDKIEGANLAEAENAPEGFLEWCKKNGAVC